MFKRHYKYVIILLILCIPAIKFLFTPGQYWNMHDDMQLIRQMEMEKCLYDGQIPCRWVPDLGYGYGYPLFNFYPPLPYFIGQFFRFVGFTFISAVKSVAILQFVFSALGMYLLGSSIFGPLGGIVSSLFYTYAPYHAVNIYIRGAMNEAWAAVFFPFIFYMSMRLVKSPNTKNFLGLTLSLTGLMLSHNPMLLIFSPFIAVWCLFWIYQLKFKKIAQLIPTIRNLFLSGLLTLGLSAFFTFPAILETKYVQINSMFTNYYTYAIHFVSIRQLLVSNFWGDGPSLWGTKDGLSFSVGLLYWTIPAFFLMYLSFKKVRHQKLSITEYVVLITSATAFVSMFMTHERSTPIWKIITVIQKIQFPWRFLNLVAFLTSFSVGYIAMIFPKYSKTLVFSLLSLLIIIYSPFLTPLTHGPVTDSQKFSGIAWRNQVTGGIYDYLPVTASTAPKSPASSFIDSVSPTTTTYTLSGQKKGTDWLFFNLTLSQPATVLVAQLNFPQFKVTINGQDVKANTDPLLGRISLNLNAGQNQIYIKLHNTPIRTISNIITLVSLVSVLVLIKLWKK